MDITQWYAVILGGLVALTTVASILIVILTVTPKYATFHFLKHVYYPQVHKYLRGSEKTTRFDLALIILFLVGNVLCVTIQCKNTSDLARRSGLLSVINLIPLALGAHMNLIANSCGVRINAYRRMHRWIGRVATAQGLIHSAIMLSLRTLNLQRLSLFGGWAATSIMALTFLSSIAIVRRHVYEIFHWVHFILSGGLLAAIYIHSKSKEPLVSPNIYLLTALGLQTLMGLMRLCLVLYRNVKTWKQKSRAIVRTITFKRGSAKDIPVSDVVHVHIRLARPWKPRAGQYAYLCIPGVSRTSILQSHPFYVSWWYLKKRHTYIVCIVQKRKGFTENLFLHAESYPDNGFESGIPETDNPESNEPGMTALVEGPYGKELNLESYGTVLLFATDIGIAGQLPYVAQLLEGYHNCEVKTRRIALFWELNSEVQAAWVGEMMKKLLSKDTHRILDIKLYVLSGFLSANTHQGDTIQHGERIQIEYQAMDAENLISSEIKGRKGRTVVSLCANHETSEKIRQIVRSMLNKDIRLEELDYRPDLMPKNRKLARDMYSLGRIKNKHVIVA